MNWKALFRRRAPEPALVLIPCDAVVCPGGVAGLTLSAPHWRVAVEEAERLTGELGLCYQRGGEIAASHPVGTAVRIVSVEASANALALQVEGLRRFRLEGESDATTRVLSWLDEAVRPLPTRFQRLLPLLQQAHLQQGVQVAPSRYTEADWVGFRLSEILRIPTLARYHLLALESPIERLEILERYLDQHGLL